MSAISKKLEYLAETQSRFFQAAYELGLRLTPDTTFRELSRIFANLKLKGIFQITSGTKFGYSSFASLPKEMDIAENVNNVNSLFRSCVGNEVGHPKINNIDRVKYANSMFESCTQLKEINLPNLRPTHIDRFVYGCRDLKKITYIDFSEIYSLTDAFTNCPNLSSLTIYNLGKSDNCALYDFSKLTTWGDGKVPDSRNSLLNTFTSNLYDRKANGKPEVTIRIAQAVATILTGNVDVIATMRAKGYKVEIV